MYIPDARIALSQSPRGGTIMNKIQLETAIPVDVAHPGKVLRDVFMAPLGLNANSLARALHVSPQTVSQILTSRRAISAETALRLSKLFGTTPQFWLILQAEYDLLDAQKKWSPDIDEKIKRIDVAAVTKSTPGGTKDDGKDRTAPPLKLEGNEKKVFEFLTAEKVHFDELIEKSVLSAG